MTSGPGERPFTVFLVAGEESGDQLGAGLMQALRDRLGLVHFLGVGGQRMTRLGLATLFPMHEIALHGITAVLGKIPNLLRRMRSVVAGVAALKPDVLVLIDSPDFNLRVARRVRRAAPSLAILDYVSPQVWAWRSGRARRMAAYVDQILAILPFEPEIHRQLGGPPCTYVGHPLTERLATLRPGAGERRPLGEGERPVLLVLPGSRRLEIGRLLEPFGEAVGLLAAQNARLEVVLPAVLRFAAELRAATATWKVPPTIVEGEDKKFAAFRRAHAALAASGTVTLELALAGVPMAVAYRVDPLARLFKPFVIAGMKGPVKSMVMPNLILAERVIPEFIDGEGTPDRLAAAVLPLLRESPERERQVEAFARLDGLMSVGDETPSGIAADIILETVRAKRGG